MVAVPDLDTVALASGVSGALFFSPFFMLVVGLTSSQAIVVGTTAAHYVDPTILKMIFGSGFCC